ncbi:aspartic proteinase nepenthesin-1 [Phtheirospermum japonicum]|uniref:Aspartic proteinase nepenthesin-1 n=1 Tax=Phtheirospermum japonicum TaxID=374723 RepID=A0A830DK12_9LAMI|nr:aspartic proteinase nepenthesin-1 [Phtheirospermum japonicum]
MKHRDSCSVPKTESNQENLIADDIRVKSIQSRIKNTFSSQLQSPSQTQVPINSGLKLQILNYIVTITLGGRNLTVIVDTGSDLTWVQCQPCKLCYTQPEPLFDPLTSPSYQSVQCGSQPCNSLQSATGNSGFCENNAPPTCNYVVNYGDGSYTRGDLGTDQLILGTSKVENFVFGCGRNNKGLFGSTSGLIGLGRSDLSFISQTYDLFGGVFSYCLPDSDSLSSGSLVLGNDTSVYKITTPISYTRLVQNPQLNSFYVLNLTGISIGGVGLSSPSFGKNEILIDSGTVITRVKPSIYKAIKDEFLRQFSGYPAAPGFSILDTCFDLSAYEEVNIPTLKMQFEGDDAEMSVDVSGMFYFVKRDASQVCLALASLTYEDEIGIIGNYQQRNMRVVYDTKEMKLGFAKETCNFS